MGDAMARKEILDVVLSLRRDRSLWVSADCGHEYRLADSELFYRDKLPSAALDYKESLDDALAELQKEVKEYREKLTKGFTKKSVEVKLGKTVEKICQVLPDFPYSPFDCRAMFDPIDYVVFVGASRDLISQVDFVEVKTGESALKKPQRQIRDAIVDHQVQIRKVKP